jgi:hypothetical protein
MCVTFDRATITDTEVCTYAVGSLRRVAYKNKLVSANRAPTAMVLNFPGSALTTVSGPEHTFSLMADITRDLPLAVMPRLTRGGSYALRSLGGTPPVSVEAYGDYYVVLAQQPADITDALQSVPDSHRPRDIGKVVDFAGFYMSWAPNQVFMVACTTGRAAPRHPIVVEYQPHDSNVLVAPGLDGHSGGLPVPGDPVHRDFAVAFGIHGVNLPHTINYNDRVSDAWAPTSVAGFRDNRPWGINGDYVVSLADLERQLTGPELVGALQQQ